MKPRQCQKCGGKDIRSKRMTNPHAVVQITAFRGAKPMYHVCVECGYVEIYVDDAEWRRKIAEKWKT